MDKDEIQKKKGQGLVAVIMWAAGISVSVGGLAYGINSTSFERINSKIETHTKIDSEQDKTIALLKQSACIQNQNIAAIAKALKVNVVSDPSCSE